MADRLPWFAHIVMKLMDPETFAIQDPAHQKESIDQALIDHKYP
jgi:hypothetical protein